MSNSQKKYDIAIIGAGPAGVSCAVQLKRCGIEPVLFEKNQVGGLLRNANFVENYSGFSEGLSGMALVGKFRAHLQKLNLLPVLDEVKNVDYDGEVFNIQAENLEYTSKILVVASGTRPKKLQIDVENGLKSFVFHEIADLYNLDINNKKVVIIGSGDAAFDYALNLSQNFEAQKITILNRSNKLKCLNLLQQRAFNDKKISYIKDEEPAKFARISGERSVVCKSGMVLQADYLIFAVGRVSCADFLGEEVVNFSDELKNSKKLFFIGDVKNDIFRQTAIAAGDGIRAAMEIYKSLHE